MLVSPAKEDRLPGPNSPNTRFDPQSSVPQLHRPIERREPKHPRALQADSYTQGSILPPKCNKVVIFQLRHTLRSLRLFTKRLFIISYEPVYAHRTQKPITSLTFYRGFALFDSSGNEVALDGKQGELRGLAKVRGRGGGLPEFGGECATRGVIELIPFEHKALPDVVEPVQPGLRAVDTSDGDC